MGIGEKGVKTTPQKSPRGLCIQPIIKICFRTSDNLICLFSFCFHLMYLEAEGKLIKAYQSKHEICSHFCMYRCCNLVSSIIANIIG